MLVEAPGYVPGASSCRGAGGVGAGPGGTCRQPGPAVRRGLVNERGPGGVTGRAHHTVFSIALQCLGRYSELPAPSSHKPGGGTPLPRPANPCPEPPPAPPRGRPPAHHQPPPTTPAR